MRHLWLLGKSGQGKSTALANFIAQDIAAGRGLALIDPHGDLAETVLSLIPPQRRSETVYFAPADRAFPIGFNPLAKIARDDRPLVAAAITEAFRNLWSDSWGPQLEQFLYNAVAALLDMPGGTLLGVKYILTSKTYRARVVAHIADPEIRQFWLKDFAEHMPEKEQRERTLSTLNKIGQFIADPAIRNILGQPRNRLDLAGVMDEGGIFIANLAQGAIGVRKANLLGSLIASSFHTAALRRRETRRPFFLYVDEFHSFGSTVFADMLSGIRKFGVSLTLAHQYVSQLSPPLRDALIGTVGITIAFRLGGGDAELLGNEFGLAPRDFTTLPPFAAQARADDDTRRLAMPGLTVKRYPSALRKIIRRCHSQCSTERPTVENRIERFISAT